MPEPTPQEIESWRNKLEDPEFRKHLGSFQDAILSVCEQYRRDVGMRFIRVVLSRHEIKDLESVVSKISGRRQEDPQYNNIDDVEDLIGIKIFCPYQSSA